MTHIFEVGDEVEWDADYFDKQGLDIAPYHQAYGKTMTVTDAFSSLSFNPLHPQHIRICSLVFSDQTLMFLGIWFLPITKKPGFSLGEID